MTEFSYFARCLLVDASLTARGHSTILHKLSLITYKEVLPADTKWIVVNLMEDLIGDELSLLSYRLAVGNALYKEVVQSCVDL